MLKFAWEEQYLNPKAYILWLLGEQPLPNQEDSPKLLTQEGKEGFQLEIH